MSSSTVYRRCTHACRGTRSTDRTRQLWGEAEEAGSHYIGVSNLAEHTCKAGCDNHTVVDLLLVDTLLGRSDVATSYYGILMYIYRHNNATYNATGITVVDDTFLADTVAGLHTILL